MSREKPTISRGHITKYLVDTLALQSFPVGDGKAPTVPHGWQGEPNATGSHFIPWMGVQTGTGRPTGGSFGGSSTEHILSYSVEYAAVDREQVEYLADSTRKLLVNAVREDIDCGDAGTWKLQQVTNTSIGGISRLRSPFPDYFVQTDGFDIWVSKERS